MFVGVTEWHRTYDSMEVDVTRQWILVLGFFGLMISSGTAIAKWVKILEDKGDAVDPPAIWHVNADTLKRSGNLVRVSQLLEIRSGKKWSSSIDDLEFDCRKQQVRVLRTTMYSSRMGRGTAKPGNSDRKWYSMKSEDAKGWNPTYQHVCLSRRQQR